MRKVIRSALMPYSPAQMFDVIIDVLAYPDFLPWCASSEILSQDDKSMVARLEIAKSGLRQSFTTRNQFDHPASMEITLVEGPFTELSGSWKFEPLGEDGCKVSMDLQFDFNSALLGMTLAGVFEMAADKMVDAFCDRADVLYE